MTSSTISILGIIVSLAGIFGVMRNKDHLILALLCIEMMLFGLNLFLVVAAGGIDDISGGVFALYVLVIAAAESALALGMLTAWFRLFGSISVV